MSTAGIDDSRLAAASPGGTVRARRPSDDAVARLNFRERVATSLWFVPGLAVVLAFVVSKLAIVLDSAFGATTAPRWLLGAEPDAATALTSTVAAAMLTFLAVVFSTTLVAIQLAGGQYSPRIVRVFIHSRLTHVTLAIFLATFVFALNALVEIRAGIDPHVPAITISIVYLLLLTTLGAFVTFLHGMARMLRVQYLLAEVTTDGRRSLLASVARADEYQSCPVPDRSHAEVLRNGERVGVVQSVHRDALVELAARHDVWIELLVEVGEYVGVATPMVRVHGAGPIPFDGGAITDHLLLGGERTFVQDPGFALRQLVDVAIRALSPSVNDPTTAVQAIDRIADLLGSVIDRPDPLGWYCDDSGTIRLHCREPDLVRLIDLSFTEIIRYGADSPQVTRRLRAAFDVLGQIARDDLHDVLARQAQRLDAVEAAVLDPAFTELAAVPDRHGLG